MRLIVVIHICVNKEVYEKAGMRSPEGGESAMKTLEDFYKEVQENEELKKEFVSAYKEGSMGEFLEKQKCDATPADVVAFLKGTKEEVTSEDDLSKVAGGCGSSATCGDYCTIFCA